VRASTLANFTDINSVFVEQLEALVVQDRTPDEVLRAMRSGVDEALPA
jgi:hypothetical protein